MKLKPTREKVLKCNGCTACCRGPNRILYLDPRQELDHLSTTKVNYKGIELLILDMEENGDCIYLKDNKCSIWKDRPIECREYDCREHMSSFTARMKLPIIAIAATSLDERMKDD